MPLITALWRHRQENIFFWFEVSLVYIESSRLVSYYIMRLASKVGQEGRERKKRRMEKREKEK